MQDEEGPLHRDPALRGLHAERGGVRLRREILARPASHASTSAIHRGYTDGACAYRDETCELQVRALL